MNLPSGFFLQKGKYKLLNVIGQGGFGITYRGIWYTEVKGSLGTIKTEVPVCIKEYFFKDYCFREEKTYNVKVYSETGKALFEKFKEKLTKEARILSEVHHPYIVNVLEVFEENNTAYIAMEYISGHSLKYVLEKEQRLTERRALKYVHQIGEALRFVHEKSILHLDIKPSNILIDQKDNARLIDFGVSKRYDIEQEETSTTLLTLSKGFASIEQYDSEGIQTFTPYPDIYALGATLYDLLTGQIPTESILRATRPLKDPREINPAISEKTAEAILKAMAIVPADRFASVKEMMEALDLPEEMPEEQPVPTPDTKTEESEEETTLLTPSDQEKHPQGPEIGIGKGVFPRKRQRRRVALLSASVLAVGGAAFLIWSYDKPEPAEIRLPQKQDRVDSPLAEESATLGDTLAVGKELENQSPSDTVEALIQTPEPQKTVVESEPQALVEQVPVSGESATERAAAIDREYTGLIAAAQTDLSQNNYAQARAYLEEARDLKITEEVVRLLIACDEAEERERIRQRRTLYEEKMAFGNYMIVRKKSNGRYGAIDGDANERIPCKYLSVGRTENGRAFEREDHLFDIYSSDARLVSTGVTYY